MAQTTYYPNRDWILDVVLGNITGFSGVRLTGTTFNLGEQWMSLWDSTDNQISFDLQTTPSVVKVSSVSTDDYMITGTGAWVVLIEGLDAAGALQTETIELRAQTAVISTKTWSAINRALVVAAGTGGFNAGRIWIGNGTVNFGIPAVKYMLVDAGTNISHTFVYTIPANKRGYAIAGNLSASDMKRYTMRTGIKMPGGLWYYGAIREMSGDKAMIDYFPHHFGTILTAGTIFTVHAKSDKDTKGNLAATTDLLLEDI
jgi:hypothetical protein